MKFDRFLCPLCGSQLVLEGRTCKCSNGHCFDVARENYINLNISQKSGERIGDNKDMIEARRRFLELGHYLPLADKLADLVGHYCPKGGSVLDLGCGYGYYIGYIAKRYGDSYRYLATDISKEGVKIGGKLDTCIDFCVANSFNLPLADSSIDVIICVFAPYAIDEISRVLKEGGRAIFVSPAPYHLWELKQAIYGDKAYPKSFSVDFEPLISVQRQELDYTFELSERQQIDSLLAMTPYYYKTPKDLLEHLKNIDKIQIRANFDISVVKKLTN
ncbi:MAG: methyltransferase domain-containing protein [Christensenellales bacterium]